MAKSATYSGDMDVKDIEVTMLNGERKKFGELAGKVTLVVNVASRCGLTPQYEALEALQKKYADQGFRVVGFPSNQFFQELASNNAIGEYCSATWGVTFAMTEKVKVNGRGRHDVYKELVKSKDDSGLGGPVLWNFEKFLLLPDGTVKRFRPTTKPDAPEVVAAIESGLATS